MMDAHAPGGFTPLGRAAFFGRIAAVALLLEAGADPNVAAASDLQFAFSEIGKQFEGETGHQVTFTFGSTGILTTQIENGAPSTSWPRPTSPLLTA
jgi:molybdate transport system substrate-binding protein